MKYTKIILGGLVAFTTTAQAMPTQEQTKKVEPLVMDLMRDDQAALKSGKKTRVEVAESAMELAEKADSEAAKLLLMKGAFNLYVRAGEFDKAIDTLQSLQAAIPDMPPANMANIIEAALRVVPRKNGGQLYRLLDETKTRMRYTNEAASLEKSVKRNPADRSLRLKLAEHYAYLGNWDLALENFAATDGKVGAIAKSERGGEAATEKIADFWWTYPTGKADELVKCFRTHAAKLYEDAIAAGKITGLNKVQAERRIEEAKGYGENVFEAPNTGDGLYCVIDLSGGPSAKHYSVTYRNDTPKGGWTDEYKTKKLVLRRIKAGNDPLGRYSISRDYYIGVFEFTQKQWELVTGTRPSMFRNDKDYATRPVEQIDYRMLRGTGLGARWPNTSEVDGDSFFGLLRKKTRLNLDLPTAAEWEYACRAGTSTDFYNGKNEASNGALNQLGRYDYNGGWDGVKWGKDFWNHQRADIRDCDVQHGTSTVGKYLSNPWGLYDMLGNVCEWCLDFAGGPMTGVDPYGSIVGKERITAGGGWRCPANECTASVRINRTPDWHSNLAGFRVCMAEHKNISHSPTIKLITGIDTDEKDSQKYCVIDISKGSKAGKYSVTYMSEAPKGGWSQNDKTKKIVLRKVKAGNDPLGRYSISKDFYVAIFETTQKQWEMVMGENPAKTKSDKLPVTMVSYVDVCGNAGFAKTLSSKTNIGSFDLPTEAQWEYASRAGAATRYSTGDSEDDLDKTCWYQKNSGGGQKEVGLKQPNAWGLYDMQGNVWERCKDFGSSMSGVDPIGDISGVNSANCGGQVLDPKVCCWHGGRAVSNPTNAWIDRGFRIVLNIK